MEELRRISCDPNNYKGCQDRPLFDPVGFNAVGYRRLIDFGLGNDYATAVEVLPDGNLTDYGVQWPIRTDWPLPASPSGVAMQDDGQAVIVGGPVAIINDSAQFYVARYDMIPGEAGLDTTFGEGGQVMMTV